jgi:hypothetical protein
MMAKWNVLQAQRILTEMAKQQPLDWYCPHGKLRAVGCREFECMETNYVARDTPQPLPKDRQEKDSPLVSIPRWSGYDSQSEPWKNGYEWAHDRGPHGELGIDEAMEAHGYDFTSNDEDEFMKGCEFAQNEIQNG